VPPTDDPTPAAPDGGALDRLPEIAAATPAPAVPQPRPSTAELPEVERADDLQRLSSTAELPHVRSPDPPPALPSPLEGYGNPHGESDDRVPLRLSDPQDGGAPLEGYGSPLSAGAERIPLSAETTPSRPDAGGPLEDVGHPSPRPGARVVLGPGRLLAPRELGPELNPFQRAEDRVPMVPPPPPQTPQSSTVESIGHPSLIASDRVALGVDLPDVPVANRAGSPIEGYGKPSTRSGNRVSLTAEPSAGKPPGSPIEGYGKPTANADDRVVVRLSNHPELQEGPSPVEGYGQPSLTAKQRVPVVPRPVERPSSAEDMGNPSRDRDDRVSFGPPQPEGDAGSPIEGYGKPSTDSDNRVSLTAEPSAGKPPGSPIEGYGKPSRTAKQRVPVIQRPPEGPSSAEDMGNPSRDRDDRVSFKPSQIESDAGSPVENLGAPSRSADDRVSFGPTVLDAPSGVEDLGSPSRDADDRIARRKKPLTPAASTLEAAPIKLTASSRWLPPEREVLPDLISELDEIASPELTSAGRVVRTRKRRERSSALNEALLILPLSVDEWRDRFPPPPSSERDGLEFVPPAVVELSSRLEEGQGDDSLLPLRKVETRRQRRLDYVHQRFEYKMIQRDHFLCSGLRESRIIRAALPRFVAGEVPLADGLLAQLICARFEDHMPIRDQAGLIDRLHFDLGRLQLWEALGLATESIAPVHGALESALRASGGLRIDATPVAYRMLRHGRTHTGFVSAIDDGQRVALVAHDQEHLAAPLGREHSADRREGARASELIAAALGRNRAGCWAGLRRRLYCALVTNPDRASYGLFLCHRLEQAITPQGDPREVLITQERICSWLDSEAERFDVATTALEQAVLYARTMWPHMRFVDDQGTPGSATPVPNSEQPPTWMLPAGSFDVARACRWYTIIESARMIGLRPWEYLLAVFDAVSTSGSNAITGRIAGAEWTPRAWAARR